MQENKLFYYINLFGIINLLKGYVERKKEGFAIHLTKRKAIIIKYSQIFSFRKKIKPLKDYHFIRFYTDVQIGNKDSAVYPFTISFLLDTLHKYLSWFFYQDKPQLKTKTNVFLVEGEQKLEVFIKVTVALNLLMVLISVIKIIMEKLIYANKNRKQQN